MSCSNCQGIAEKSLKFMMNSDIQENRIVLNKMKYGYTSRFGMKYGHKQKCIKNNV